MGLRISPRSSDPSGADDHRVGSILFVHGSDEGYGADRMLVQMVQAALGAGYLPVVLLPDDTSPGWLSHTLTTLGIQVKKGPLAPVRRRYLRPVALPNYLLSLWRAQHFLEREWHRLAPAIVHVNGTPVLAVALVRQRGGAHLIWHIHELILSPRILAVVFRLIPLLAARRVIAISDAVAEHLKALRIHSDRVVRLYNGVASRTEDLCTEIVDDGVVAVFIGRLSRWKGYEIFVEAVSLAVRRVGNLSAVIAGAPPPGEEWRREDLARRIVDSGLADRIQYLGLVHNISEILRPGRIVVVPSTWPEPFGLVTVEAMLAGCAVIATRHGGSVEIVQDGVTGILVEPGDASALSEALERLTTDAGFRNEIAARGRQDASRRFGVDQFASTLVECWAEMTRA